MPVEHQPPPGFVDLRGQRFRDRHAITEVVGAGDFHVVFGGRDEERDRDVVLQVMQPPRLQDPKTVERFERRRSAAQRVNHPRVVRPHDGGELFDGKLFAASDRPPGVPLDVHLGTIEGGVVPWALARPLLLDLMGGLLAIHRRKLVHGRIRPGCCWVEPRTGAAPRLRLLDLGFNVSPEDHEDIEARTGTSALGNDALYMAPESITGQLGPPAGDVYLAGLVAYTLLSGRPPFHGANSFRLASMHLNSEPAKLSERAEGVDEQVAELVARMLAKAPEDRPAPQEVIDFLEAKKDDAEPPPELLVGGEGRGRRGRGRGRGQGRRERAAAAGRSGSSRDRIAARLGEEAPKPASREAAVDQAPAPETPDSGPSRASTPPSPAPLTSAVPTPAAPAPSTPAPAPVARPAPTPVPPAVAPTPVARPAPATPARAPVAPAPKPAPVAPTATPAPVRPAAVPPSPPVATPPPAVPAEAIASPPLASPPGVTPPAQATASPDDNAATELIDVHALRKPASPAPAPRNEADAAAATESGTTLFSREDFRAALTSEAGPADAPAPPPAPAPVAPNPPGEQPTSVLDLQQMNFAPPAAEPRPAAPIQPNVAPAAPAVGMPAAPAAPMQPPPPAANVHSPAPGGSRVGLIIAGVLVLVAAIAAGLFLAQ
ncbi:MAG: serine/threonine-protein kinase [Myxococcota bacterium]